MNRKPLVIALCSIISVAAIRADDNALKSHHSFKSHKVQVVINIPIEIESPSSNSLSSFFATNTAAGPLSYVLSSLRDVGSYYTMTGLMYKKGTVSKYQNNYALDKHGNPLQQSNSIGSWQASDFVVTAFDLISVYPAAGTRLTAGMWSFFFNDSEEHNNFYAVGRLKANVLGESNGIPIQYGKHEINAGTGEFTQSDDRPKIVSSKMYLSSVGNILIKIEFDREVEVELS